MLSKNDNSSEKQTEVEETVTKQTSIDGRLILSDSAYFNPFERDQDFWGEFTEISYSELP
ncbi:hypothetical protein EHO59_13735 [Leptospira semungkisensis]|uniref:Uncharacterized protein n=1 Tax=Leptospira semungkisensis TaxID=2484985 RepID=A0A4R9FRG1_9LEPT|nr:hypothetical protein [Leptospira semungkisensis]TGK00975.1 hypothetical protein EHO59_13735 [Leptospira semungkisensis]